MLLQVLDLIPSCLVDISVMRHSVEVAFGAADCQVGRSLEGRRGPGRGKAIDSPRDRSESPYRSLGLTCSF